MGVSLISGDLCLVTIPKTMEFGQLEKNLVTVLEKHGKNV